LLRRHLRIEARISVLDSWAAASITIALFWQILEASRKKAEAAGSLEIPKKMKKKEIFSRTYPLDHPPITPR
jgi:hypothetical protein